MNKNETFNVLHHTNANEYNIMQCLSAYIATPNGVSYTNVLHHSVLVSKYLASAYANTRITERQIGQLPPMSATVCAHVSSIGAVRQTSQHRGCGAVLSVTVTVTVTKVFILRFLLKDRKCITESFTYIQRSPG